MKLDLARDAQLLEKGVPGVIVVTEAHSGWSSGWVAKILGKNDKAPGGLERTFLNPFKNTLSRAGNGLKYYQVSEDGVYEADSVWRSYTSHRVAFQVKDGQVTLLADSATSSRGYVRDAIAQALGTI